MNMLIAVVMTALALTQHSAMGFDQDSAEHHFILEAAGGSIRVTMKKDADPRVLDAVRGHLRTIAEEFSRGDFGKPFQTHGEVPAGVAGMTTAKRAITYRYEDIAGGGAVRIRTADVAALKAIHDFLRYQITEHKTGDPLRALQLLRQGA